LFKAEVNPATGLKDHRMATEHLVILRRRNEHGELIEHRQAEQGLFQQHVGVTDSDRIFPKAVKSRLTTFG
jgi:hypothetical protein